MDLIKVLAKTYSKEGYLNGEQQAFYFSSADYAEEK